MQWKQRNNNFVKFQGHYPNKKSICEIPGNLNGTGSSVLGFKKILTPGFDEDIKV